MLLGMLVSACSSIDCSLSSVVLCHMQFHNTDGDSVALAYPLDVYLLQHDGDTTHYINKQSTATNINIPLSIAGVEDSIMLSVSRPDTIRFIRDGEVVDSIITVSVSDVFVISKTNEPWFESVDCTPHYNHTIESVKVISSHFIDSIVINEPYVNNGTKKNLYIRLHNVR